MYHYYSIVVTDDNNRIGTVSVSREDDGGASIDVRPVDGRATCCAMHLGPQHAERLYEDLGKALGKVVAMVKS